MLYDLYDPKIQSIELLRLEKRLDADLLYLRDAELEYSTFPEDMEAEFLPEGAPVPLNPVKVGHHSLISKRHTLALQLALKYLLYMNNNCTSYSGSFISR